MTAAKASKDKTEGPVKIRKYPNRRYYNTRASQHITLQEICDLVRAGHDIRVTDSRSGDDITGAVLTQILLELESPKLAFFPTSLLQHLIRIDTGFLDNFAESYFRQAFASFGMGGRDFSGGQANGFPSPVIPETEAWVSLFGGLLPRGSKPEEEAPQVAKEAAEEGGVADLRDEIETLRKQLDRMEKRSTQAR